MTSYLVAPNGNDATGDGSYASPFLTIAKAAAVAAIAPVDTIEVASGTVTETAAIAGPLGFKSIVGRGTDATTIAINRSGSWISLDSADADRLLILDATVTTLTNDAVLVAIDATDATAGSAIVARCRLSLAGGSVALAYAGPDPQTFLPLFTADLLHCVVEGPEGATGGYAFSGTGSPIANVAARNCIFRRLAAVNAPGTQPVDSDRNLYFGNDRDLTLGAYGDGDLRDADPLLVDPGIDPLRDSPVIGAGADLSAGYGRPNRVPPAEVGLAFLVDAPSIGAVEPVAPDARTNATATNLHLIVAAFSGEVAARDATLDAIGRDRALATAGGGELARRWGALTGLRFLEGDADDYRRDLQAYLEQVLPNAPAWHALRELARIAYPGTRLVRHDDVRRYHFQAGKALKLWADYTGGSPSWTFYLTAGEAQLEASWLNVRKTTFAVSHANGVHWIYIAGSDPLNADGSAKVQRSTTEILDETRTQLAGNLTFRRGETLITASADLSSLVQQHRRIAHGFSGRDYVVDRVIDARTLELRYPYSDEDHVGLGWVITPNVVFGTVTTDAVRGVIDINSPGRLDKTTRPFSRAARAHGYELILETDGSALASATLATRVLFETLGRAHPVHKRAYFRLRDDRMALVLGQPWPYDNQGNFSYREVFDDPAWEP